jgi:hypothetical protein
MKKKLNEDINYFNLFKIINRFLDFVCEVIPENEIEDFINEQLEFFSVNSDNEEHLNKILPILKNSNRIVHLTGCLLEDDYYKFIDDLDGMDENIKNSFIEGESIEMLMPIHLDYEDDNNETHQYTTVYIIYIYKYILPKRGRKKKTKSQLELELRKALNVENYELAVKLRDKIKKIK